MEFKDRGHGWSQCGNYPYLINRDGTLYSLHRDRPLNPPPNHNGYRRAILCNDGQRMAVSVHRLVAGAFVHNPDPIDCVVNHIDGNKLNNAAENLEWIHQVDNMHHYHKVLKPVGEPV